MDVLSALARAKPAGPPPTITTSLSCGTAVAIARKRVQRKDLTTFLPLVLARSMMRRGVTHRRMDGTARPRPEVHGRLQFGVRRNQHLAMPSKLTGMFFAATDAQASSLLVVECRTFTISKFKRSLEPLVSPPLSRWQAMLGAQDIDVNFLTVRSPAGLLPLAQRITVVDLLYPSPNSPYSCVPRQSRHSVDMRRQKFYCEESTTSRRLLFVVGAEVRHL